MITYSESIKYLESFWKFGIKLGLERIEYLLEKLGNPHKKFKSIHVAGTNGKGSVCAFAASILKESGLKTGMYSSPHLIRYEERFKINGKNIPENEFCSLIERIKGVIDDYPCNLEKPTEFEILTALAFLYFADEKVDIAVIETGLGGRLDSTNVIDPLACVITNVAYDHTNIMGKTIAKIAKEKAGIIKKGVPLITAAWDSQAYDVISKTCKDKGARLIFIDKNNHHLRDLQVPLAGDHQIINAEIAIAAIGELKKIGFEITDDHIKQGLSKTIWPARFQTVSKNPLIIIDGAHNPSGARAVCDTLARLYPDRKIIFVPGILSYKDFMNIVKIFCEKAEMIIAGKPNHNLACDPALICEEAQKYNIKCVTTPTIPDAIDEAKKYAAKDAIIFITGSLVTAGEALKHLNVMI